MNMIAKSFPLLLSMLQMQQTCLGLRLASPPSTEENGDGLTYQQLWHLYEQALREPCTADYYVDAWFGLGSQISQFSAIVMDAALENKTVSLWTQAPNNCYQLAKHVAPFFEEGTFPICTASHSGTFKNDQTMSGLYRSLSYHAVSQIQRSFQQEVFRHVQPSIVSEVEKIYRVMPKPYASVHVRWGDKLKREAGARVDLDVYIDAVKAQPQGQRISSAHLMTIESGLGEQMNRTLPTYQWSDKGEDTSGLIIDILLAAKAHVFVGTESSNIFRLIYHLRPPSSTVNVEDHSECVYPIRYWSFHFQGAPGACNK